VLGFDDLRAYLQARRDTGSSVPRIASELRVSDWQVQAALSRSGVRLAPRPQRRRYTEERIAARVAELGFTDVEAYLVDRVVDQAWLLAEVAAELAAHRLTVRRRHCCIWRSPPSTSSTRAPERRLRPRD